IPVLVEGGEIACELPSVGAEQFLAGVRVAVVTRCGARAVRGTLAGSTGGRHVGAVLVEQAHLLCRDRAADGAQPLVLRVRDAGHTQRPRLVGTVELQDGGTGAAFELRGPLPP